MIASVSEVVDDHIKQQKVLDLRKQGWLPLWQNVTNYILPRRWSWDLLGKEGEEPEVKLYDVTALDCLQTFVDGFQGNMMSEALTWLRLLMEDPIVASLPGVADYLEVVDQIILDHFRKTTLYDATNEFIADWVALGTGIMLVDDDLVTRQMNFSTRHLRECAIAENRMGQVDVVYRYYPMSNRQVVEAFPGTVSQARKDRAKEKPFDDAWIIHAAFPSSDQSFKTVREPRMPYTCEYIDVTERTQLYEGGYESFPYLVARCRKNSGETYGRGPGSDAIAAVMRVNGMARTLLHAGNMAVLPPLNVPVEMKGKERMIPDGRNYYSDPTKVITSVDVARNYPIGRDQEEDVREQIRSIFRSRIFLLLQALEQQKVQTATWVRQVASEQAIILGPMIGRFSSEFQIPLVRRSYQILFRSAVFPPPPPVLMQSAKARVEFMGPLAQAQRRYHQSQGLQAGMEFLAGAVQLYPDGLDIADGDELVREGMDFAGMPQRVIRETDAVEYMRKRRAETIQRDQQAQAEAAQQQLTTQNANKLNEPVKPGSMLQSMLRQRQGQRQPTPAGAGPG